VSHGTCNYIICTTAVTNNVMLLFYSYDIILITQFLQSNRVRPPCHWKIPHVHPVSEIWCCVHMILEH